MVKIMKGTNALIMKEIVSGREIGIHINCYRQLLMYKNSQMGLISALKTQGFLPGALFLLLAIPLESQSLASDLVEPTHPNDHLVGWLNTFIPGSGQCLLGNCLLGAGQATLEISTFWIGFHLSRKTPLTLDGAPERIPRYRSNRVYTADVNIDKGLEADLLQEFGIKLHMINTYNAYREAADVGQGIDQTTTGELFLAPFKTENLSNPWVYVPLGVSVGAILVDYFSSTRSIGAATIPRLTTSSNILYGATYGALIPLGSGVPEEMFYRGFFQNEMYRLAPSPYVAIPLSTLAYTFSHEAGIDRISAAITGTYLGYLAYRNHGQLSQGITFHFWADIASGVESFILLNKAESRAPVIATSAAISF